MSAGSKSASPAKAGIVRNGRVRIAHARKRRCGFRDIGLAPIEVAMPDACGQRRKKLRRRYTNATITASGTAQPIQAGGCQRRVSGRASRLMAEAATDDVIIQPYQYIAGPDLGGLASHSHSPIRGW